MGLNTDDLTFLVGDPERLRQMSGTPALPAFSERAVTFLSSLSRLLLRDKRSSVDVKSYAYWIRRASLEAAAREGDFQNRLGRGVALHIAPSNVPVNFAVSMTSSLLAGNCTVVRVSGKPFPQVDLICEAMNLLLGGECAGMRPYVCVVRYEHSDEITQELSALCDVRVIWGGDRTIEAIRRAPLPPRAVELAFADRRQSRRDSIRTPITPTRTRAAPRGWWSGWESGSRRPGSGSGARWRRSSGGTTLCSPSRRWTSTPPSAP